MSVASRVDTRQRWRVADPVAIPGTGFGVADLLEHLQCRRGAERGIDAAEEERVGHDAVAVEIHGIPVNGFAAACVFVFVPL